MKKENYIIQMNKKQMILIEISRKNKIIKLIEDIINKIIIKDHNIK